MAVLQYNITLSAVLMSKYDRQPSLLPPKN